MEGIKRNRWITIKMINDLRFNDLRSNFLVQFRSFSTFFHVFPIEFKERNSIANFINFIQCDISNGLLFFIMLPWSANSLDMNI